MTRCDINERFLRRMRRPFLLLLATVVLGGCVPSAIDADRAGTIARDFVIAGQPSGTVFREITVGAPTWQTNHWRVQVDAVIDYPPPSQPGSNTPVHYLIDVDGSSGRATIYAQG